MSSDDNRQVPDPSNLEREPTLQVDDDRLNEREALADTLQAVRHWNHAQLVVLMERLHAPRDRKAPTVCKCCGVPYPCATIDVLDSCDIAGDWQPDDGA